MTDPAPQRDRSPSDDRPVMGDRPDLETEDPNRPEVESDASGDMMSRLLVPGLVVLVIVVVLILLFIFM